MKLPEHPSNSDSRYPWDDLTDDDPRHGTVAGWWAHFAQFVAFCPPCTVTMLEDKQQKIARRKGHAA